MRKFILLMCALLSLSLTSGEDDIRSKKQYRVFTVNKLNWHGAVIDCLSRDLQLATVESEAEEIELENALKRANAQNDLVWISATDLHQEGVFVWMSTGKPVTYSKWNAGEPNNSGNNEHCALILSSNNRLAWNDGQCKDRFSYVCETKPPCCVIDVVVDK